MSTIVTRAGKGSPLTNTEVDSNFTNLNTDKLEINAALGTPASVTLTNATGLPTAGLVDNAVTDEKLRDSGALSVIGRSANSTGNPADISAGANHQVLRRDGSSLGFGAVDLSSNQAVTGTLPVNQGGTGITSFGSGVATWLGTPSSANLAAAVTDETGTGALVFATSPTLVTPALGTPASGVVTNLTGTASININGTVGATTPAAGAFTTLNTSGAVVFNEAGANVDFRVEGDTEPNLLFVDASADNVGIGTATPSTKLHAYGGTIRGESTSATSPGLLAMGAGPDQGWLKFGTTGTDYYSIKGGADYLGMLFFTAGAEVMRIDPTGNVGIGTTSPGAKLHVAGDAILNDLQINTVYGGGPSSTFTFQSNNASGVNDGFVFNSGRGGGSYGFFDIRQQGTTKVHIGLSLLDPDTYFNINGNLGIGTSSPDSKLHVLNSTVAGLRIGFNGTSFNFYDADTQIFRSGNGTERLRLDSSGNLGLGVTPSAWGSGLKTLDIGFGSSLTNANSATQTWLASNAFYDTSWKYKNTAEASYYDQASGRHAWFTAPSGTAGNAITFTQVMTLTAAGNLGIGTTTPLVFNTGGSASARLLTVYNTATDAAGRGEIQIGNAATTSGQITGNLLFGCGASTTTANTVGSIYSELTASSTSTATGALVFATSNAGTQTEKMRLTSDGYLRMASGSGGIQFNGDTAAANALDDYEEGAWTPTISGSGLAPTAISYTNQFGRYTKIGRVVEVSFYLEGTYTVGVGAVEVTGLPFTILDVTTFPSISGGTGYLPVDTYFYAINNTTRLSAGKRSTGALSAVSYGDAGVSATNFQMILMMTYFTN
jgi:hypothetical protein